MSSRQTPFEEWISEMLKEFESHLAREAIEGAREQRMRGAREFARLLIGRPHRKGERTKGTI